MLEAEISGEIKGDKEEGFLGLEDFEELDKCGIFARYHNSIVVHLCGKRTLKALCLGWQVMAGMHQEITRMISECSYYNIGRK